MADPVETALKLNELMERRKELLKDIANLEGRSFANARSLAAAIQKGVNTNTLNSSLERTHHLTNALGDAAEKAGEKGNRIMQVWLEDTEKAVRSNHKLLNKLGLFDGKLAKFGLPVIAGLDGMVNGFKFSINVAGMLFDILKTGIAVVTQLATSIISLPFKLLGELMAHVTQGSTEFRQELEKIRGAFGDLARNESKAIITGFRNATGELSKTGLSVNRTMGFMHERLQKVHEMATQLGEVFHLLHRELANAPEELFAYSKGLGLTEAGMKGVGQRAVFLGTSFQEQGRIITSTAYQMGEAFGMNGKLISKDIGEMVADFKTFGNIAPEVLAGISVYARKLGIEIKALQGVVSKFDNFEDAAQSVAQLNQAFGMNLDVLEQLKDQDPASRLERMRKAFFQTGKSVENMTRQERALLAQQTGLEDSALDLAFSQKSQSVSYEEIQKQSKATERQQLSQAEAMVKLADSIERIVRQGPELQGSFFSIFMSGFSKGVERSREFRQQMHSLRGAMQQTFYAGMQVGRDFMKFFPGVKEMFGGLADMFKRDTWKKMLDRVVTAFRDFFKAMTTNPQTALPELMEKLKENFFDFFQQSAGPGRKILDGFKTFGKAILGIFGQIATYAVKGMTKIITAITNFIRNPDEAIRAAGAAQTAADSFLSVIVASFLPAILEAKKTLVPALKDMFKEIFGTLDLEELAWEWGPKLALWIFGPAVISGILKGALTHFALGLARAAKAGIMSAFSSKMVTDAAQRGAETLSNTAVGALSNSRATGAATGAGDAVNAAGGAAAQGNRAPITAASIKKMALIGTFIVVGIGAIALAMAGIAVIIQKNNLEASHMLGAVGLMVGAGVVMLEVAAVMGALSVIGKTVNPAMAKSILVGLLAVGLVAAGMAYGATHMIEMFKGFTESEINRASTAMYAASGIFLAASAVTAVAGVVGAAVLATAGIGGLAVAAGFATISTVIGMMTDVISDIIQKIKAINIEPGFEKKQEVFVGIIGSVGSMAASLSGVMEQAQPSFDILGRQVGPSFTDKLKEASKFITTLSDSLQSVITNFIEQAKGMHTEDGALVESAMTMSTVIGNLASAARNLQPPPELMDSGLMQTMRGDSTVFRIAALGNYINSVSTSLSNTFRSVTTTLKENLTGDISDSALKSLGAVGEVLRSIGFLASHMANVIRREYGNNAEDLATMGPAITRLITAFMEGILGRPGDRSIFTLAVDMVKKISEETSTLTESQAGVVSKAAEAIGAIFVSMSALAGIIPAGGLGNLPDNRTLSQELSAISEGFFGPLMNSVSTIITAATTHFKNLTKQQVKNLKNGFEALGSFFEVVQMIPNMFKSLREFGQGGNQKANYNEISRRLATFGRFIVGDERFSVVSFLSKTISALNSVETSRGLDAKVKLIGSSLEAIANLPAAMTALKTTQDTFDTIGIVQIAAKVKGMVDLTNETTKALGDIRLGNINAQLRRFGSIVGLESTNRQTFEITNRSFKVNLSVSVKIDAEELEKVLLDAKNARIARTK